MESYYLQNILTQDKNINGNAQKAMFGKRQQTVFAAMELGVQLAGKIDLHQKKK